ncbi:MAG: hypothetical protein RLY70_395 [Planctomycetota bacterium]
MSRPSIAAVPLSRVRTMAVRILGLTVAFAAMAAGPSFPHGKAVVWRAVPAAGAEFRGGAAIVDVTPVEFPVLVNGGMLSNTGTKVKTPLNVRALVLDDGHERLGIAVVDSCMVPRELCDEIKQLTATRTKLRPDRLLISATHTHSAAAAMGCLGTEADPKYVPFLRLKVAEALAAAEQQLEPARVGWGVANAAEYTALRQWVRRPDRLEKDPFGNYSIRANMHAGRVWDDVTGEAGPEDPDLSLISVQARDGRPLALLANFSMHYFSDSAISADYFGLFCGAIEKAANAQVPAGKPAFVAIMSHGCSGDIWRRDYTKPIPKPSDDFTIESYSAALAQLAIGALPKIAYRDDADLAMSETRMRLRYRVPDAQRLEWAQRVVAAMGDRPPKDTTEVYAREQILLHERQSTEIVVQGLRIGDIAIATTPNETYALTGLKLKLQSPLAKTMVIELANGGDGYIPPAEQHPLGGYNTWAARSAGLETGAESKITAAALAQLEAVAGQPRRVYRAATGPAAQAVLDAQPVAYWRLDELGPSRARDSSGRHRDAFYEPGVLFFLEGPRSQRFLGDASLNRAAFFAGGRLESRIPDVGDRYTVSLWIWNGMPANARPIAGWMFGRGDDQHLTPDCVSLGLANPELVMQSAETAATPTTGGSPVGSQANTATANTATANTATATRLCLALGAAPMAGRGQLGSAASRFVFGKSAVERWKWRHVALVRDGDTVRVHLDGAADPELVAKWPLVDSNPASAVLAGRRSEQFFFGGRPDAVDNWEGRLDEISVFDRAVTPAELARIADRP